MERNKSIQRGQHYLFGLSADLGTIIDIIQENERLGDVMDRIVSGIMRTRWGVSLMLVFDIQLRLSLMYN
jgi:PII-like signaling protein